MAPGGLEGHRFLLCLFVIFILSSFLNFTTLYVLSLNLPMYFCRAIHVALVIFNVGFLLLHFILSICIFLVLILLCSRAGKPVAKGTNRSGKSKARTDGQRDI